MWIVRSLSSSLACLPPYLVTMLSWRLFPEKDDEDETGLEEENGMVNTKNSEECIIHCRYKKKVVLSIFFIFISYIFIQGFRRNLA